MQECLNSFDARCAYDVINVSWQSSNTEDSEDSSSSVGLFLKITLKIGQDNLDCGPVSDHYHHKC